MRKLCTVNVGFHGNLPCGKRAFQAHKLAGNPTQGSTEGCMHNDAGCLNGELCMLRQRDGGVGLTKLGRLWCASNFRTPSLPFIGTEQDEFSNPKELYTLFGLQWAG